MTSTKLEHFRTGDITVGVVGLGYVGLPLSVEIARSGLNALGFDVERGVVDSINGGHSHIDDLTDHSAVDYGRVLDLAPIVVDARHVTAPLLEERDQRPRAWVVKGGGG